MSSPVGASAGSAGPDEDPRADLRWGTVPALLADAAERLGSREAVVDGNRRLRYRELVAEVTRCTRGLMAIGCAPGDRVAIWAPNSAEWVIGALGALGAGAVLVPLNTRFKGAEAAFILRASTARVLLTVQGFLGLDFPGLLVGEDVGGLRDVVVLRGGPPAPPTESHQPGSRQAWSHEAWSRQAWSYEPGSHEPGRPPSGPVVRGLADLVAAGESVSPDEAAARASSVGPDDVSDLIFTSGTTGRPKGAVATHAQTLRTFGTWASIVGLRDGDRYLVVNPFFHTFGYKAGLLASMMAGATVVPEPVFDVGRILRRVTEERITVLPGPPTIYQSMLTHPDRASADLSSLRLGVTGAAVVPVELVVAMRKELGFETVLTAYGLTESCGTVTMCRRSDPPDVIATTSGRAIPGLEVRIVGGGGTELPAGEAGEIVVRGYTVMRGYWEDADQTAAAIDGGGWLHTGDIGVMDEAGNVRITDRLKDMFVVGGFNAYPAEIEAALRAHAGVGQVAVIGVPDERLGEVGCAYVVPTGEAADGRGGDAPGDRPDRDPVARGRLARDLLAYSRQILANYKAPRHVVLMDELPVNAGGKVLKRELRARHAAGADEIVTLERSS